MKTKHTKGKWYYEKSGELESKMKAFKIGFTDSHTQGFLGFVSSVLMPIEEPEANAKLIELLIALMDIVDAQYNSERDLNSLNNAISSARKTIKKATE